VAHVIDFAGFAESAAVIQLSKNHQGFGTAQVAVASSV
jgi:hypothetical protein